MFNILPVAVAYAEEAAPAAGGISGFISFLPIAAFIAIFYFLLIRPQQKSAKLHREMLGKIEKGDTIVTRGGIYGKVVSVKEDSLMLEIAENVRIKVERGAVQTRKPSEAA
ncbi:MAG: preprotein translocase subunit YajC [Thermodesulfobacteriota bacterium]